MAWPRARRSARVWLAAVFAIAGVSRADADSSAPTPGAAAAQGGSGPYGFLDFVSTNPNLLGDIGGLRTYLGKYGVTLTMLESAETLGNQTGGARQSFEVNGLTTVTVALDTQKAFGWNGGAFNVSGLHIWGGDLSATNLYTLQSASNIEAEPSVRLWELWYQQKFGDKFDVKFGEQSIDQEFMLSQNAGYFVNAVMGWPELPTANMPAGGPVYPFAGLGVRARAQVSDAITVLAGVFNGSPAPLNAANPQSANRNGVAFPLNTGVLVIAELQYSFAPADPSTKGRPGDPLPGAYKVGAWFNSENFNDLQYDKVGVPLASPASNGVPATHRGNFAIYSVADQMIWRDADPNRNVNFFVRPTFTTLQDRNLVSFSVDAGLTMLEPIPGRAKDALALGLGLAQVSNSASGYDRNLQIYQPLVYTPVRGTERFVEATYQYQAAAWCQMQPVVQYVFNPGAGVANPNDPTQKIKNELVIGLRTNVTF